MLRGSFFVATFFLLICLAWCTVVLMYNISMKNFFQKVIAFSVILFWIIGFAHVVSMVTMKAEHDCPYAARSHEICKSVLQTTALKEVYKKAYELIVLAVIGLTGFTFLTKTFQTKTSFYLLKQLTHPTFLQELFSNRILNPKAP